MYSPLRSIMLYFTSLNRIEINLRNIYEYMCECKYCDIEFIVFKYKLKKNFVFH